MEKLRGNPSHQEEEDSEDSDNPKAEIWYQEPVLQLTKKVKRIRKRRPLSPHIAGHIALNGSRLLHGQEDLWKTTWRSHGRFKCEFGYVVNVHEYHSSSSGPSRKRHDTNLHYAKTISWTLWHNYLVK